MISGPEIDITTGSYKALPAAILAQYEYEEPLVRAGTHLMHSHLFRVRYF